MRLLRTACIALSASLLAAQQTEAPRLEHGYWSQTVIGSVPASGAVRLRVSSAGDLTLRGDPRPQLDYRLLKRIRASRHTDARHALDQISVHTTRRGEWLELSVRTPRDVDARLSLWLNVPRSFREVRLASQSGAIQASGLQARLDLESAGGPVSIEDVIGPVALRVGGGSVRLARIRGPVQCVSGGGSIAAEEIEASAELVTGGGEIVARKIRGALRATTGGGNIRIQGAGAVSASTAGGLIEILEVAGPTVAHTAAGNIRIRNAGRVQVQSGSGKIQLENVTGPVRAATSFGDLVALFNPAADLRDSRLETAAGDITVFLPSNISVSLEAIAGTGHAAVISEFPGIAIRRLAAGVEARGDLNHGGPSLRLSAPGGAIYLKRAQSSAPGSSPAR